ncbi:endo-type 6-aminohexanoate oligomer hydrolase [Leucobacter komagatae]|uniref:endo-type 6-aminohexanoate oligomer hydrolase n=1 Tax=Leucobacter komagatae TaxID=55969 RepID=UPI000697F983|nr:endo-type 6-aminohexanoate oligomer hydrolase [Leucobacter komagatae]
MSYAFTEAGQQTVVDPAPRLAGKPAFGGPGNADFESLTPRTSEGRDTLHFDFPGVRIGSAHYDEGPTGATVIHVPAGARTAVDARGGAVGLSGGYGWNHAICLAGGSVYGLEAGAGVSAALLEAQQHATGFAQLQLVSSAIIYDFSARDTAVYPDATLGRAALESATEGAFALGRAGAGMTASAGKVDWSRAELTGQGAAFRKIGDIRVLAVVIPNPVGVIVDRAGNIVRGNYDEASGTRRHPVYEYADAMAKGVPAVTQSGNTTISAIITNVKMTDVELNQFAKQIHSSMHRGIQPFHTDMDGDTLFALTTDEISLPASPATSVGALSVNATALGTIASEVMWDALLEAAK